MSLSREFPGQKTFTMTRGIADTGALKAVMAAAALMTGTGPKTVRL